MKINYNYDDNGNLFVVDEDGDRWPTEYAYMGKDRFFAFMKMSNMVKLED